MFDHLKPLPNQKPTHWKKKTSDHHVVTSANIEPTIPPPKQKWYAEGAVARGQIRCISPAAHCRALAGGAVEKLVQWFEARRIRMLQKTPSTSS